MKVARVILLSTLLGVGVWPWPVAAAEPRVGEGALGPQDTSESRSPGPRGRRGATPSDLPSNATPAEVEQLFDRLVRGQARSALQLTAAEMQTVAPPLTRLIVTKRRVQRERQRLLTELAVASRGAGPVDEAVVGARLEALEAQRVRGDGEVREAQAALDAVLTVAQRARFRVFERRIEQQRLELLARARRAARESRGAGTP